MQAIQRGLDRVVDAAMIVAEVAIVLMMLHITAEILVRWLLHGALDAVAEIVAFYYMAGLTFLSLAFVTRGNGHIAAEIFTDRMSHLPCEILEGVISLALALFMIVFAWQTFNEASRMTTAGEIHQAATMILPKWPSRWFLPFGAALMAVVALRMGIRKLIGEPPPAHAPEFKPAAHE